MNVQIGDTVLVFDVYGTASAAIVTSIGDNLTIGCASFMHDGTLRPIKQLLHVSAVMHGFPCNFWDFRPSQKETPPIVKAEPKNSAKFISTEGQPYLYWDINLQKVEIKPRPYFEDKPALGTFEWALVALKNGHKVRRFGWYKGMPAMKYECNTFLFSDGHIFSCDTGDLLATDWVLA